MLTAEQAISLSVWENRSVTLELPSEEHIYTLPGMVGYAQEALGEYDVWGDTDEGSEWRLKVKVVP